MPKNKSLLIYIQNVLLGREVVPSIQSDSISINVINLRGSCTIYAYHHHRQNTN